MLSLSSSPGAAYLDPDCPVNWDWQGNRSLLGEWAVIPEVSGRFGPFASIARLADLTRGRGNRGTPLDLVRTTGGVGGQTGHDGRRPGGRGYINCPGTSPQQFGFTGNITYGSSVVTLSFWAYLNSTSADQLICESSNNANTSTPAFLVYVGSTGVIHWVIHSGANNLNYLDRTFTAPATGAWHHYLGVLDNTTTAGATRAWLDGVEQTLTTAINTKSTSGNYVAAPLNFAGRTSGTLLRLNARLDGVSLWARDCSAEAGVIYYQARRGNPGRWRLVRPASWLLPATVALRPRLSFGGSVLRAGS